MLDTTLHPTTLHYTSPNYTSLHFPHLHFTTLHPPTLHPTTLHYTTPNYTSPNYTSLHFTTLHPTKLHYTLPNYTSLHFTQLHFTTLHPTTLHYTLPNYTSPKLHFTTLPPSTLHYTSPNYTSLNFTQLHFTKLHPTILYSKSCKIIITISRNHMYLLFTADIHFHLTLHPTGIKPCHLFPSRATYNLNLIDISYNWGQHVDSSQDLCTHRKTKPQKQVDSVLPVRFDLRSECLRGGTTSSSEITLWGSIRACSNFFIFLLFFFHSSSPRFRDAVSPISFLQLLHDPSIQHHPIYV